MGVGNGHEGAQVLAGIVQHFDGEGATVRVFREPDAGVLVVEERFGGIFEDGGGEGCGSGTEVGDFASCGHGDLREMLLLQLYNRYYAGDDQDLDGRINKPLPPLSLRLLFVGLLLLDSGQR